MNPLPITEKEFPVAKRWRWKAAAIPAYTIPTIFIVYWLSVWVSSVPIEGFALFCGILAFLSLLLAIANYFAAKKRASNFHFSFNQDNLFVEQVVLRLDTPLIQGLSLYFDVSRRIWSFLFPLIPFFHKTAYHSKVTIDYNNVRSVFIHRGIHDKLLGLSEIVITLKNINYSKINPPVIDDFGWLGDSVPQGSFKATIYSGQRIIVIPGLKNNIAQELLSSIRGFIPHASFEDDFPRALTFSSFVKAIFVAVIICMAVIAIVIIFFLLSS